MSKNTFNTPPAGFNVHDVLFVLCKHKWKVLSSSLIGFATAAAVFFSRVPIYQSQAKLLVRYVLERGSVDTYQDQSSPGGRIGNDIINTEIEILTSMDLALAVADTIGPGALMADSAGSTSMSDAASAILAKLEVGVGQSSNVLRVTYGNRDPRLSQQVLTELVRRYFEKHLEIHRSAAAFDIVAKQTDVVREQLKQTEQQLNKLRTDSGILSLVDATGALSSQRAKTQEDLIKAKADFAELQAGMKALVQNSSEDGGFYSQEGLSEDHSANHLMAAQVITAVAPPQSIAEYRSVMELLAFLQKRAFDLNIKFKSGNSLLALNQKQVATYEAKRQALITKYPDLAADASMLEKDPHNPKWNMIAEKARLAAISAKIEVYETHLKEINEQFNLQYTIGAQIEEVDRRKQMEDAEYRSLEANLKNAKIDQTLDPSRMPNITVVQQPTEPIKTYDSKIKKLIMCLAGGGMAAGIGLAFLIETVFNRRVSRPIEIQARLQLPLLLSIPYIRRKERGGVLLSPDHGQRLVGNPHDRTVSAVDPTPDGKKLPTISSHHFILPYSETIRDRILFNFEVNNVTHKPKLVAVTGLSSGAGSSTIAAGLATAFSEIPGKKVLLVDLNACHADVSMQIGEIPGRSLNEALRLAKHTKFRETPQNLYHASACVQRDARGLSEFSPVHLHDLMPHLQTSEYDYIIFDMPPVNQTSCTLSMARMMDKVLLVLDGENTTRDGLVWGYGELVKGKADVSCVFNKNRTLAPDWLIGGN